MTDTTKQPELHFETIEGLHKHYKKRIAKAKAAEDEAAIRVEWADASTAWHASYNAQQIAKSAELGPTPSAPEAAEAAEDPAAAARAEAIKRYGYPAAANGAMGAVAGSTPTPIDVRLPAVEVTTDKESQ